MRADVKSCCDSDAAAFKASCLAMVTPESAQSSLDDLTIRREAVTMPSLAAALRSTLSWLRTKKTYQVLKPAIEFYLWPRDEKLPRETSSLLG